jgi:DNA replication protein DnaC
VAALADMLADYLKQGKNIVLLGSSGVGSQAL